MPMVSIELMVVLQVWSGAHGLTVVLYRRPVPGSLNHGRILVQSPPLSLNVSVQLEVHQKHGRKSLGDN